MANKKEVRFTLRIIKPWPWVGKEKGLELINIFQQFAEVGLSLERYGTSEKRTKPLEDDYAGMISTWEENRYCIFKSGDPWKLIVPVMMYPAGTSYISIHIPDTFFSDIERQNSIISLSKLLYSWSAGDHGYIAHIDEIDSKNAFYVGEHKVRGGNKLDKALPGVYWVNFFGRRYVNWIGQDKFKKLPAHNKEQLVDGGWMIITRPNLIPFDDEIALDIEQNIRKQLGENLFFNNMFPDRKTIPPPFAIHKEYQ